MRKPQKSCNGWLNRIAELEEHNRALRERILHLEDLLNSTVDAFVLISNELDAKEGPVDKDHCAH